MQQKTALNILKTGRNVYLTGAAGAGKTYVLNAYIDHLKAHHVGVGITASTGIAATHIGGMTIHAWSGIGIKDYLSEWDVDALTQRQPLVKRFERTDVLIIDEVSMLRPEVLDMVDTVAKALKRSDEPFGGMQVVLCGDFYQLPPVVRGSGETLFADSASAWALGDFKTCYLTEQHRHGEDMLARILNDIRDGDVTEETHKHLNGRMSDADVADAVVLNTHNAHVDAHNQEKLAALTGESAVYDMQTSGRKNMVESLIKSVLAPFELELKVGARVMFVKNAPDQEYVNGTLGEVIAIDGAYPIVRTHDGREVVAHPVTWEVVDDGKVVASVAQVPLRLAWAITVHKSQGMTLDAVIVDLSRAFTPGQGYVALSRARTLNGLYLRGLNAQALAVHPYVQELDVHLRAASDKWEQVFERFSEEKVRALQEEFIQSVAGDAPAPPSLPTHLQTLALLKEHMSLKDIARERSLTVATIIGHLEKLRELGEADAYTYLMPDADVVDTIREETGGDVHAKLAPLHAALNGIYTFEELRLARLFVGDS